MPTGRPFAEPSPRDVRRALIVAPDRLSSFLAAEPAFAAIHAAHAGAEIAIAASARLAPFLVGSPHCTRILSPHADEAGARAFDLAYDLAGTARSARFAATAAGGRWIGPGPDGGEGGLGGPAMRKLLRDAGLQAPFRLPDPGFGVPGRRRMADRIVAARRLEGAFALLSGGTWPPASWAALGAALRADGTTPVFVPHPGDAQPQGLFETGLLASRARVFVAGSADAAALAAANGCSGLLLDEDGSAGDALFGRPVVILRPSEAGPVDVSLALMALRGLGVLGADGPKMRVARGVG